MITWPGTVALGIDSYRENTIDQAVNKLDKDRKNPYIILL